MSEQIIIVPAYPAPPYLLTLLPTYTSDPYAYLTALLSAPTSHLILSPPIRLPRSLFDKASAIPEIKGSVVHINFQNDTLFLGLHPTTKYALTRAYESFLQSYPNRCVPVQIKDMWRGRFWRNMDWVQWVVPAELLCWIDPRNGDCDLTWYGSAEGMGYKLPSGVPEMLRSVASKVKRLFVPTLEEERSIWEIPYQIEDNVKAQFRLGEEQDCRADEEPTIETAWLRDAPNNTNTIITTSSEQEAGTNLESLTTSSTSRKRRRKRRSYTESPDEYRIFETGTGGKSVLRKRSRTPPQTNNVKLRTTPEGRAYIDATPHTQLTIRRRLPPPPPPPPPPRPPGSYPTPPADHTLQQPPLMNPERVFEPLNNNTERRPSPLDLPSPLEDYNECRDKDATAL